MSPHDLHGFLHLSPTDAQQQWRACLARSAQPGQRQGPFLPIETLLCHGLFYILRPNRYGGGNIHTAPAAMHQLALTFRRSAVSLQQKMFNLDGTRAHGGHLDLALGLHFAAHPEEVYRALYRTILLAARAEGLSEEAAPDFLDLLEDDDEIHWIALSESALVLAIPDEMQGIHAPLSSPDTERLALQRVRIGQQRFARQVLANYGHQCGFCGLAPQRTRRRGLLIASHIKPWRDATSLERIDPRNGIAACPLHDRAFDAGLLTVNGGLRIHRAEALRDDLAAERMAAYFGPPNLAERLQVPEEHAPRRRYLEHHQQKIYRKAR